ncbi:glycoside hydrolase family 3 N-terminal domain-containing protein [uncultured Enterococcus sp.]|uniref:glycoside hydrolase family 3 N-terminal domain-containing protein n=1 Tax=uncultured Enterococcus sp. TaxID=167972 RepID=UPI0025DAAF07|nr:glycoside hydrolase family 3 N-terminal domain-containing protein [uncultured Enterococcus sp.]
MKGTGAKALIFMGFVLVFVLLIGGMWYFMHEEEQPTTSKESSTVTTSSETTTTTSESAKPKTLDERIATMTVEEKVGQLFFARVPDVQQIEDIKEYDLGGYVLFGRDVQGLTERQLKDKILSYQQASKIPMLIGSDEEGGWVSRLSTNEQLVSEPFASPQTLYAQGGIDAIVADTKTKADLLRSYGITTGLFPVADVATDPEAFIYDRTLGQDAKLTADYVTAVTKALKEEKVGSTLKHFPGYGNNRDSHVEIVTDTRSLDELRQVDFVPFIAGIQAGADSILVSHNIVSSIDPTEPASISPAVHKLLRDELHFNGVIMTDDMDMAGLADFISQDEAGLKALQAGNDLVMSSSYAVQIPVVIAAVENGDYPESQLDASVKRVLQWKQDLGLLAN